MADIPGIKHFYTKVAGVTHRNDDRSRRQEIIEEECEALVKVTLDHEPDNPHDPNAVKVLLPNGDQIGYLDRRLAGETVRRAARGYRHVAFISAVTGGDEYFDDEGNEKTTTLGVNLVIIVAEPEVSDQDAQRYADEVVIPELQADEQSDAARLLSRNSQQQTSSDHLTPADVIRLTEERNRRPGCAGAVLSVLLALMGLTSAR